MQAIILAAGMGKRLKELTSNATKCMVEVNGVTMIQRMLTILDKKHLNRIVMVVGYEGQKLIDYVGTLGIKTPIEFISNDIYDKTNNIYSLYLAKKELQEDDTLLLESDLIFEEAALDKLIENPYPSLALVAKFESWMDGTVVELDEDNNITQFRSKKEFRFEDIPNYYKTVNIYKFAKEFSCTHYVPFLEAYVMALGNNEYYEQVLKVIALLDKPGIKALPLEDELWYEIDDVQDLNIAESIFAPSNEKLKKFMSRYGGYWRYPHMMDFCYLVNPFFPSPKLVAEMKANFERLLCNYPSGMDVNSLLAAKYFGIHKENTVVGNGAAELIKSIMGMLDGKVGITQPTFEEYPNRRDAADLVVFRPQNDNFSYTADDLMDHFGDKDISVLVVINPDNPSGNFIPKADLLRLAQWAEDRSLRLIVDESFADFADCEEFPSLFEQDILTQYPHMIVVKSISKSFGVPGLRLGVAASGDDGFIARVKKDVAIWNINSFGEFYMQIFEKYKSDYAAAMKQFRAVRAEYAKELAQIPGLRVIPSQANYLMCEVTERLTSNQLAEVLLNDYNILIKDLSGKKGFEGRNFIRIAVKDQGENNALVCAMRQIFEA